MVCRLVEQQQAGLGGERADEPGAAALPAGCCGGFHIEIDAEARRDGIELVIFGRVASGAGEIAERCEACHGGLLFEADDREGGRDSAAAFVELDFAGDELHQRGFAGTIAADEGESIARIECEIEAAEQPVGALPEASVFESEDWISHGAQVAVRGLARKRLLGACMMFMDYSVRRRQWSGCEVIDFDACA